MGFDSPTLLFVHGYCCSGSDWDGQIAALSKHYRCAALDLPGHGASAGDDPSMAAMGAAVNTVKDALGDDVILIGHSLGCKIIREAYRQSEARVAGLAFVDGSLYVGRSAEIRKATRDAVYGQGFHAFLDRLVAQMFSDRTDPAAAAQVRERAFRIDPEFATQLLLDSVEWDIAHAVGTIREIGVPTLVAQCMSFDTSFGWRSIREGEETPFMAIVRNLVPGSRASTIPESGHFPMLDAPEALSVILSVFVDSVVTRAG